MTVPGGETSARVSTANWGAGIRGLIGAWVLASSGVWYGSAFAVISAGLVFVFALFGPLRLGQLVFTRRFAGLLLRIVVLAALVTAGAFPAGLAANSRQPTVAALGSVLFIGLLTSVAALVLAAARGAAVGALTRIAPLFESACAQAAVWVTQITGALFGARTYR